MLLEQILFVAHVAHYFSYLVSLGIDWVPDIVNHLVEELIILLITFPYILYFRQLFMTLRDGPRVLARLWLV